MAGFEITGMFGASGFHITFENGWKVSVQWGPGTYSTNNMKFPESATIDHATKWESDTAEIAAFSPDDNWYTFEDGDEVSGHKTPDEVVEFLNMIARK